jgi:pimeloyl-ACP methyl ester carboxylesterase
MLNSFKTIKLLTALAFATVLLFGCRTSNRPLEVKHLSHQQSATLSRLHHVKDLENGFNQYHLKKPDGSLLFVYGKNLSSGAKQKIPLLVVVSGSGCGSVFKRKKDGSLSSGLPGLFAKVAGDRYAVIVLEKRGVKLGDGQGGTGVGCTEIYHKYAGLDFRIKDHLLLIEAVQRYHSKIIVVGHSEGTDVAAGLTARSKDVNMLGFMSGGGPTQVFDFLVMSRKRLHGKDGELIEEKIGDLLSQLEDVFADPQSNKKMLFGHPYSRWSSYFRHAAIDSLVRIDVPIFLSHGSKDESVPIESADFIAAEFLRRGKKNLTYRRYSGLDHSYYSCRPMTKECDRIKGNKFPEVIRDFLQWVESPKQDVPKTVPLRRSLNECYLVAKDPSVFDDFQEAFSLQSYDASTKLTGLLKTTRSCRVVIVAKENFNWTTLPGVEGLDLHQIDLLLKSGSPFAATGAFNGVPFYLFGVGHDRKKRAMVLRTLSKVSSTSMKPGTVHEIDIPGFH